MSGNNNLPTSRPTPAAARPPSAAPARKKSAPNKKLANTLIALSTAATIAIYAAGYARTSSAAASASAPEPVVSVAVATTAPSAASLLAPTSTATTAPATATTGVAASAAGSTAASVAPTATTSAVPTATTAATATVKPTATTSTTSSSSALKDGSYTGSGTSRHGGVTVDVVIKGGKIVSAEITTCGTRYPCSKIAALPGEVVARQSANVDFVSGATDSSTAYKSAVTAALAQAR